MTLTCVRRFTVDCGHRVLGHEGKCSNLHGHTYLIEVHARGRLDLLGRVVDFGVLKERIGGWLDTHWDHGFLAHEADPVCAYLREVGSKLFTLPYNPTAENLARHLLIVAGPDEMEGTGVEVVKVVVHETPNCFAEAVL